MELNYYTMYMQGVSPHPDPRTQPDLRDADYAQQYVACVYPVGCHSRFHIVMMTRLFSL